jgi:large subunit ribosomal protein L33
MACTACKSRNYMTTRNKKEQGSVKLELRKFCPKCGKHVAHKETK